MSILKRAVQALRKNPKAVANFVTAKATSGMQRHVMPLMARTKVTASLYYVFFSRAFDAEKYAVLNGKRVFAAMQWTASNPRLRRNVHRLEKGMIMVPRRPVFAEDYITETARDYARAVAAGLSTGELQWARDVLTRYFEGVTPTARTRAAQQIFEGVTNGPAAGRNLPYASGDRVAASVSTDALMDLMRARVSTRWFEPRPLEVSALQQAVRAAAEAPSACNRQPFRYIVLNDPAEAARVSRLAGGTAGFAQNIPCLIVSVGDLSCYPNERDRHVIYIDASLANMQMMLSLQSMGISTCAINWPDIEAANQAAAAALGLGAHEQVVMLMAAGYATQEGGVPYSRKKDVDQLLTVLNKAG